jgi:hypothetical protein
MDIVLTVGGIRTLVNVVIIDMTHAFFVSLSVFSWGVATTIVAHAKVVSYCDQHPNDDIIPLILKIFGYLHRQVDDFIVVPTWHGPRRALVVLLFRLFVHFISGRCQ